MTLTLKEYLEGEYEKHILPLTKSHMQQFFIDNFGGWSDEVCEKRFFKTLKDAFVKLFYLENVFVGYVSYSLEENNVNSYLINDIHIVDEYQHKGYGSEILEYIQTQAQQEGITQLKVFVFKNNPSLKFYERKGFTQIEFLEKSNSYIMIKHLTMQ